MLDRVYAWFTERARQVVVLAEGMARNLGHSKVGTEHMLLGLIAEREGLAAWTLDSVGLDLESLCATVVRIVGQAEEPTARQLPFTRQATCAVELANVECQWPSSSPHRRPRISPLVAIFSPRWWPRISPPTD